MFFSSIHLWSPFSNFRWDLTTTSTKGFICKRSKPNINTFNFTSPCDLARSASSSCNDSQWNISLLARREVANKTCKKAWEAATCLGPSVGASRLKKACSIRKKQKKKKRSETSNLQNSNNNLVFFLLGYIGSAQIWDVKRGRWLMNQKTNFQISIMKKQPYNIMHVQEPYFGNLQASEVTWYQHDYTGLLIRKN